MNNPGKIKLKKKSNKFASTVMFVLIFLLSVSTIITIQLRSNKRQQDMQQSAQTSAATVIQADESEQNTEADIPIVDIVDVPDAQQEIQAEPIKATNPVYVMPVEGDVAKSYSATELVYSATMDDWRQHLGCDIVCVEGEEVVSMADGTVTNIYTDPEFGCTVVVTHKDGVITRYSNLSLSGDISTDTEVSCGQIIGTVTDNPPGEASDKLHIHIEAAKNDIRIDPLSLVK